MFLRSPVVLMVGNLFLAVILFLVFDQIGIPGVLACSYPMARSAMFALGSTLALNLLLCLLGAPSWAKRFRYSLVTLAVLFLLTIFLGTYRYSPLGSWPPDDLFVVLRQGRLDEVVASGEIISLPVGVPAAIAIASGPETMSCQWNSLNGGAWDDPASCDTIYIPPAADYDILTVRIKPGCNLSPARGQIKISIMP